MFFCFFFFGSLIRQERTSIQKVSPPCCRRWRKNTPANLHLFYILVQDARHCCMSSKPAQTQIKTHTRPTQPASCSPDARQIRKQMSAHHLPYLCRHMLWCEEVGQLESGHWHLTAVVSSTAVRAHRWLLLNILHMRVFVWTRGRTCSISRDILSQCWDWWCPHGLGTLIYEVTGLTHCFFLNLFFFWTWYTFYISSQRMLCSYCGHMWITS